MKTCGATGPPSVYTCQLFYNFSFAVTSKTCTSKPREIDLMTCKERKKNTCNENHGHSFDFQKSQSKDNSG